MLSDFYIRTGDVKNVEPVGRDQAVEYFCSDKYRGEFVFEVAGYLDNCGAYGLLGELYRGNDISTFDQLEELVRERTENNQHLRDAVQLIINADRLYSYLKSQLLRRRLALDVGTLSDLHGIFAKGVFQDSGIMRGFGVVRDDVEVRDGDDALVWVPPFTAKPLELRNRLHSSLNALSEHNTLGSSLGVFFVLSRVMPFYRLNRLLGIALSLALLVDGGYMPFKLSSPEQDELQVMLFGFYDAADATEAYNFLIERIQKN